jgi:hypothetical protein
MYRCRATHRRVPARSGADSESAPVASGLSSASQRSGSSRPGPSPSRVVHRRAGRIRVRLYRSLDPGPVPRPARSLRLVTRIGHGQASSYSESESGFSTDSEASWTGLRVGVGCRVRDSGAMGRPARALRRSESVSWRSRCRDHHHGINWEVARGTPASAVTPDSATAPGRFFPAPLRLWLAQAGYPRRAAAAHGNGHRLPKTWRRAAVSLRVHSYRPGCKRANTHFRCGTARGAIMTRMGPGNRP